MFKNLICIEFMMLMLRCIFYRHILLDMGLHLEQDCLDSSNEEYKIHQGIPLQRQCLWQDLEVPR